MGAFVDPGISTPVYDLTVEHAGFDPAAKTKYPPPPPLTNKRKREIRQIQDAILAGEEATDAPVG